MASREDRLRDIAVRRSPVNRAAARITQPGPQGLADKARSEAVIPWRPFTGGGVDLTGRTVGSLTVVGIAGGVRRKDSMRSWVCRCVCGRYQTRHARAINNPRNANDCCDHCRHVQYLRRRATYLALGFNPDEEDR